LTRTLDKEPIKVLFCSCANLVSHLWLLLSKNYGYSINPNDKIMQYLKKNFMEVLKYFGCGN
ncbi:MAG: hypothetical protein KHW74_14840, partial [Veillonella sp.]|nr:hypothetical protein [Veillonella sp.]